MESKMSGVGAQVEVEILALLAERSPRRFTEMVHVIGDPITVDQACVRLQNKDQIYPVGQGVFEISADGRRRINIMNKS